MVVFLPCGWGDVVRPCHGVSVSEEYSQDAVRKALGRGEKLFLIGADALGTENGWCFAKDHLALFGTGDLAGQNYDSLGPRFPNLRGMYFLPEMNEPEVPAITVLRVPDIRFSTAAELRGFPCDALVSHGLDLAVSAAHGGGRVILALNCRTFDNGSNNSFSFLNKVIQETKEVRSSEL